VLTGANTISGTTTISAGTLQLGNGGTNGTVAGAIVNNGALVVNRSNAFTLGGAITGTGGLTKQGAGTLTLSGANAFTGGITVNAGGIVFSSGSARGGGSAGSTTVAGGAFVSAGYAIDQTFLNRVSASSAGVVALATNSSINLDFNAPGLANVSLGATSGATYSGVLTPAANTYRLGGGGSTLTVSSNLTGANSLVVANNGTTSGTVILSGTNNYTGTTSVNNGTLRFSSAASMNLAAGSVTVANGATVSAGYAIDQAFLNRISSGSTGVVALNISSNNNLDFSTPNLANVSLGTTSSVSYGNATTIITPANNTFRFGGGGTGALTVNAPLTGALNPIVIGSNGTSAGTVIVASTANTYGGSTTVNAGVLQFNSPLSIGGVGASVTVNAGAIASAGGAYAIDQAFLGRINTASTGVVALATASGNPLDFGAAGLTGVSLGATGSGYSTPAP
jgi:autotransporter-associated beta strand protein